MNVEEQLMKLTEIMEMEVAQDIYTGNREKYIVFTFEDERSALDGDDEEQMTTVWLSVKMVAPIHHDYKNDKKKLKKALKELGFNVESVGVWANPEMMGTKRTRSIVFAVNMTGKEE